MIHIIMIEEIIKIGVDQIGETGEFNLVDKVEVDQGKNRIIGMIIGEEMLGVTWEHTNILKDRIEENIEEIIGVKIMREKEVGVGLERSFSRNINKRNKIGTGNSRSTSGSRVSTNRDKFRCYKCRNMIIMWKIALHLKKKER